MTTTNVAIVDDRDPLIHYVGAWIEIGTPKEFNGTTKWSAQQGSTASFTFVGTSVIVYGTVGARPAPHASMNFLLDNSIRGSYIPPNDVSSDIHHEPLWTSPSVANGSHTLVITQTATGQPTGEIYLDYLMYNTTSTSVGSYFIDDRDLRINFRGGWRLFGSDPDFQHTSRGSSSTGDYFSLEFEGKSISFYGGINNGSAGEVLNASMVIDGGPPVFFVPPIQTAGTTVNNLIFNSGDLSDGKHTLVATAENNHTVWLDYLLVTPTTPSASPAPGTSSGSSTSSPPATETKHNMIYVGAAIGGVVLLALIVAAAFFFLRRRKRRRDLQPAHLSHVLPTPFSDFISTGAATLQPPFTPSHPYSTLSGSGANLPSTSASYSLGNTANPRPMHGPIPSSKRDAYATRQHGVSLSSGHPADPSLHGEAPPQYLE